jgi:hypothetical protein
MCKPAPSAILQIAMGMFSQIAALDEVQLSKHGSWATTEEND